MTRTTSTDPLGPHAEGSFLAFVDVWNQLQGQPTPDLHVTIACWLEDTFFSCDRLALLMAFRGSGKSTLVGLFGAWLLAGQPETRILVMSADTTLAGKMVRNVKRIVETHPMCRGLKPDRPDQWAADRFTVTRPAERRDPSMLARGVLANVTGSHADVIICDDVEVPNTCDSPPKRADLRERLLELDNVVVPGGTQLYVGTPHTWWSIYADVPRPEIGETKPFLDGARRLVLPVQRPDGSPVWPERFPAAEIARIRTRSGPSRFASQMQLQPVSLAAGRLDPDLLRPYGEELDWRQAQGRSVLRLGAHDLVGAAAWWDPAFAGGEPGAGTSGDGSVVACVFQDRDGRRYLHRIVWLTVPPGEAAAIAQCRAVARFLAEYHLPVLYLESNGIGTFLPDLLRRELTVAGVPAAVRAVSSRRAKVDRILDAWEAPLAAGQLHAHRSVWDTRLIAEMRAWRPDRPNKGHDDGLDAVAGCLLQEPARFGFTPPLPGRPDWRPGGRSTSADASFDV